MIASIIPFERPPAGADRAFVRHHRDDPVGVVSPVFLSSVIFLEPSQLFGGEWCRLASPEACHCERVLFGDGCCPTSANDAVPPAAVQQAQRGWIWPAIQWHLERSIYEAESYCGSG